MVATMPSRSVACPMSGTSAIGSALGTIQAFFRNQSGELP